MPRSSAKSKKKARTPLRGRGRVKPASRTPVAKKKLKASDGRLGPRHMKCPVAGCRKKTKGPRYNYYCEAHKRRSAAAKARGIIDERKGNERRRHTDRRAKRSTTPSVPQTAKEMAAGGDGPIPFAKDLASRCEFVAAVASITQGVRCARPKHEDEVHIYAAPMQLYLEARTPSEIVLMDYDSIQLARAAQNIALTLEKRCTFYTRGVRCARFVHGATSHFFAETLLIPAEAMNAEEKALRYDNDNGHGAALYAKAIEQANADEEAKGNALADLPPPAPEIIAPHPPMESIEVPNIEAELDAASHATPPEDLPTGESSAAGDESNGADGSNGAMPPPQASIDDLPL